MEIAFIIAKSAAILTLFYVMYIAVLQKDTFFTANRHYLLSGIIAALVIPFIEFTKTVQIEIPVTPTPAFTQGNFTPLLIENASHPNTIEINWWSVALVIYCVGVLILISRLFIQLASLHNLLRTYPKTRRGNFTFVQITDNIAPFSFFKTICFNPALHSREELQMIIAHEKVHARQLHTLDVLLTQILLSLQWINPLAWYYKKSLEQNLEFLADSGALQAVNSVKAYQHTLVKVSSTTLQPALTNQFYHSLIKKRIVMLNKETSRRRNLLKLGLILPVLGLFMYSFNVKEIIEYKEIALVEKDTAFAKADSKKSIVLHATMKDTEIDNLKNALENDAENLKILFTERKRNNDGALTSIMVETKYPSQIRYYKNVTFGEKEGTTIPDIFLTIVNGNDLQFSDAQQEMIFRTSLEGVKAELFPKSEKAVIPALGKSPLYIINDNPVKSQDISNKTILLDGEVTMKGKGEATQKNDLAAKNRVIEFIGKSAIKEDRYATGSNAKQASKPDVTNQDPAPFKIEITKDFTKEQLDALVRTLKTKYEVRFTYSDLNYNTNNEITSLGVKIKDELTGNTSNVRTSSGSPIGMIIIERKSNGGLSVRTIANQAGADIYSEERHRERNMELHKRSEERREEMEARRNELLENREERLEEMKAQREEMRSNLKQRGNEMKEEMRARREELKERMKEQKDKIKEKQDRGYVTLDNTTYYFTNINGETKYFDRFGVAISEEDPMYDRLSKQQNSEPNENIIKESTFDIKNFEKDPLVIVDGEVYKKRPIDLDPNQIDNVTVLKGKKARSFYGKKGENGVVIIEMKE